LFNKSNFYFLFSCLVVLDEKGLNYHLECLEAKKTEDIMKKRTLKLTHPGSILKTEFLEPNNLTVEVITQDTKLDKETLKKLLEGKIQINSKIASELGSYFKMSTQF
jgi:hypothetical protein